MHTDQLEQLGLSKNEARLYETLLKHGESAVGELAAKSGINRRNIYDALVRLMEKGLAFEIVTSREQRYRATDPRKLSELVEEKRMLVDSMLPSLEKLFAQRKSTEGVVVYRGLEGWKTYLRDIIRIGEDVYTIGAKGAWSDPRLKSTYDQVVKESNKKNITYHLLFDGDLADMHTQFEQHLHIKHKYLPRTASSSVTVDIFGDHVVFFTGAEPNAIDEKATFTTFIDMQVADAMRMWFALLWKSVPERRKK